MRLAFTLTDVFTTGPLTGNPLAVCWSLGHWSVGGMQAIAREFAYSETAFIESLPSSGKAVRLRIFTPRKEILFAGHPVLGSAAAIWKQLGQQRSNQLALILPQFEISIQQERDLVWFEAPAMRWAENLPHAAVAPELGLTVDAFNQDFPCQVIEAGVRICLVPLRDWAAAQKAQEMSRGNSGMAWYLMAPNETEPGAFKVRLLAQAYGIVEDPATGSAAAALGYYCQRYGYARGAMRLRIEQGHALERPSLIRVDVAESIRVGGRVRITGEGKWELPDEFWLDCGKQA